MSARLAGSPRPYAPRRPLPPGDPTGAVLSLMNRALAEAVVVPRRSPHQDCITRGGFARAVPA